MCPQIYPQVLWIRKRFVTDPDPLLGSSVQRALGTGKPALEGTRSSRYTPAPFNSRTDASISRRKFRFRKASAP